MPFEQSSHCLTVVFFHICCLLSLLLFYSPIEIYSSSVALAPSAVKKGGWSVWETGSRSEPQWRHSPQLIVSQQQLYHINYVTGETPSRKIKRKKHVCVRSKKKRNVYKFPNRLSIIILKDPNGNSLDFWLLIK